MFHSSLRTISRRNVCQQLRHVSQYYGRRKHIPSNTVINFVPQQEAWVIERFGRFSRVLEPGLAILIPLIEQIKYVQSLKEVATEVPSQSAITLDNVTLQLDGILYYRVEDPYQASYGVEDCEYAVTQLAQTTMRSELGKITLDKIFQERTSLNSNIVNAISEAASAWGIKCLRYEIRTPVIIAPYLRLVYTINVSVITVGILHKNFGGENQPKNADDQSTEYLCGTGLKKVPLGDIQLPSKVKEAMQMQVEAERKKRAAILESEGKKVAAINVAEGQKQSQILASEGRKLEQINIATGEANAILAKANARAEAILKVAESLSLKSGDNAAALTVAEQYVQAFGNLAKTSNTVILPANTGDAASMVAQAMAVYSQVSKPTTPDDPAPDDPSNRKMTPPSNELLEPHESQKTEVTDTESEGTRMDYDLLNTQWQQVSEPSHFTAASSPTRKRDFS